MGWLKWVRISNMIVLFCCAFVITCMENQANRKITDRNQKKENQLAKIRQEQNRSNQANRSNRSNQTNQTNQVNQVNQDQQPDAGKKGIRAKIAQNMFRGKA